MSCTTELHTVLAGSPKPTFRFLSAGSFSKGKGSAGRFRRPTFALHECEVSVKFLNKLSDSLRWTAELWTSDIIVWFVEWFGSFYCETTKQTNKQTNNTFSKFLLLFREVVKLGPSMGYCCC